MSSILSCASLPNILTLNHYTLNHQSYQHMCHLETPQHWALCFSTLGLQENSYSLFKKFPVHHLNPEVLPNTTPLSHTVYLPYPIFVLFKYFHYPHNSYCKYSLLYLMSLVDCEIPWARNFIILLDVTSLSKEKLVNSTKLIRWAMIRGYPYTRLSLKTHMHAHTDKHLF